MKFKLQITLGNAAMLSGADVATALRDVAETIGLLDELTSLDPYDSKGSIRDANGNRVGEWAIVRAR